MVISLLVQTRIILFSFLGGLLTGLLFDTYRVLRGFENPNKILTFIEDILFWILCTFLVFLFLLYTNQAFMGLYVYLYILFGLYLYMKLLSRLYMTLQYKLLTHLGRGFRIFRNNASYPVNLALYKVKAKKRDKI